jgi:hypothetical protein
MALFPDRARSKDRGPTYDELYVYLNRLLDISERASTEVGAEVGRQIDQLHTQVFRLAGGDRLAASRTQGGRFAYRPDVVASALHRLPARLNGFPWGSAIDEMRTLLGAHLDTDRRAEALAVLDKLDRTFVQP